MYEKVPYDLTEKKCNINFLIIKLNIFPLIKPQNLSSILSSSIILLLQPGYLKIEVH